MAKSTIDQLRISELVAQAESARLQLTTSHEDFRERFDFKSRIMGSFKGDPQKWIGGLAAVGLLGKFLFRSNKNPRGMVGRVKEVKKQRNILLAALGIFLTVAKPIAKVYATKLLQDYFKNQMSRGAALRPARTSLLR